MSTELALIDTIDTAKEIAADRMDMTEILAKIESLIQVRLTVVKSGIFYLRQALLPLVTGRNSSVKCCRTIKEVILEQFFAKLMDIHLFSFPGSTQQ